MSRDVLEEWVHGLNGTQSKTKSPLTQMKDQNQVSFFSALYDIVKSLGTVAMTCSQTSCKVTCKGEPYQ